MLFFLALPSSSLSLQPEKLTDHLHCHISFNPIVMIHFCCCSVAESSLTLCDAMDCSMLGFPVLHHLLEFAQTHVHWVSDTIQPSHPLLPPSPALNLSQHQDPFQWVNSLQQVAKVLPMNIQGWFPLGLTSLILLSKGLSGVFSRTTVQKHQFFSA